MESKRLHSIIGIWTNICRFLLAVVFIFSGFVKAVDPLGTQYKIQDYLEAFGLASLIPAFLPFLVSVLQAMVEFCLGGYLFFGIRRRITTLSVLIIMSVMTPLTLWLAFSNPISDCGCFGDAVTLTNWETFGKNVVLLAAAVSIFKWGNRITPLLTRRFDWLVAMYTFLYITGMALYCYRELPVFDFRPYHIGADIRRGMEIPEGVEPTVYETRFVLQKDGKKKEFTLEDYPDSTWTFVDSRTIVKKQGYEPPIRDFSIIRQEDGEDMTEEILNDDNYTFLLVAHQLRLADDSTIDLINELYDYSVEYGYKFYCLTSSSDNDIEEWQERTGAEYPFCLMDDITLKTMIRSNPGLMLLKEGVVINKWSVNNLPDEYVLTDRLDKLPLAQIGRRTFGHKVVMVLAWFVFPLLFFSMVDIIWEHSYRRKKLNFEKNKMIH
ncbi:MAG: DoxX family protein [Phocaeicola sp.]|uniref:BT_3928 family protein n=1 Tax=Phocaeicola sp. TaxID=2773926 RepID=UPI0023CE31E4|nr:BT_3928 family protein [Phocaeicola sp.]MDE5676679.1 DoxX family protein [Phocaeicola sp.]MDE6180121.1 DoxX family protein [Phocaeicola sp.]